MALAENCDTQPLIELVQSKVEGAEAIRHHGKEMAFSLPVEQVSCFPGKFNEQLANYKLPWWYFSCNKHYDLSQLSCELIFLPCLL